MKAMIEITCAVCGKKFRPGNRPDGLPNGVGFQLEDGTVINVCAECIIREGQKHDVPM